MKSLFAVILFASVPLLAADDKPWPEKGDTVYVAAELVRVFMMPYSGSDESKIPPCVPFTLKRIDEDELRYVIISGTTTRTKTTIKLEGKWKDRVLKTEGECEARFKDAGQPKIVRTGNVHTIP